MWRPWKMPAVSFVRLDVYKRQVLRYANLIRKACEKGLPDIIAHPDLFMFSKQQWTPAFEEAARIICQSACDEMCIRDSF